MEEFSMDKVAGCDGCGENVTYRDPYGQVGLLVCGECNGGLAIAGPCGTARQADGSWDDSPADPFEIGCMLLLPLLTVLNIV